MQMVNSLRPKGFGKVSLPPAYEFHTHKFPDLPTLSDAPFRRSYARHLHTHGGNFGACLPANSHIFPPGNAVFVIPQEFAHTKKIMFGGMPLYIPHPPIQEDLHSKIFLSTATLGQ
ncbi:hypothetical protein O181_058824 [Austropuccinia psidii MF-1]|uniref:Uncharacterized protein n=1 Tax=Austropuccinia psidii MF-1 TaxID=1389203 RepID=A0A9Q3ED86_9BASI|nr:hypothetical protein [Austropuccinia psidii MF-1]